MVSKKNQALLLLVAAGLCLGAGFSMWSSLTFDNYVNQHISHQEDLPVGLSRINDHKVSTSPLNSSVKRHHLDGKEDKVILFWTSWFRKPWWVAVDGGVDLQAAHCPETRCVFTQDRSRQSEAAAILFESQRYDVKDLPRGRGWWQRWVWVHVEAPPASANANRMLHYRSQKNATVRDLSSLFNWTMTYHPESDILEPYGAMLPLPHHREGRPTNTPIVNTSSVPAGSTPLHSDSSSSLRPTFLNSSSHSYVAYLSALHQGKTLPQLLPRGPFSFINIDVDPAKKSWEAFLARPRLVAWMSSHCPTVSRREEYVKRLQQHVPVDIYGSCGSLRCGSRKEHRDEMCWREVFGPQYLFYLAFENALCDSYVTEKLWWPLIHGLVPVVLGGANYTAILPPHSYIDAGTLTTRQLGDLLLHLQKSPREYADYHLWRAFWRATLRPPLCELCLKLHSKVKTKTQLDIAKWWRETSQCQAPSWINSA